ncbi:glycosyltransferase N-terminal domain-containing protein [Gluconacetobacter sp. Hr-1-5]|uniref:glycosyltransferase N-terminal domain-containing protein n=1 Tax=Gluconacetobacter sp. Hr-1-5 TaxID=3395370 RepID=UPI003B51EAE8
MLKRLTATGAARAAAIALLRAYLRLAIGTTRWTFDIHPDAYPLLTGQGEHSVLVAFWHEALALTPALLWWSTARNPTLRPHVLISRNRDGRLIADIIAPWGAGTIAGSTDRKGKDKGGAAALRQLLALIRSGDPVVITPDGPRGPRRQVEQGAIGLARLSGAPIVPVGGWCAHWRLGGWDRMMLPLPFGRGRIVCGAPIAVTRDDQDAARSHLATALDAAMHAAAPTPAGTAQRLWAGLATLLAPALTLLLHRRLTRDKEIRGRQRERMGLTAQPRPPGRLVWLHAASVGETLSILPVITELLARDATLHVLVTTATVTAATLLEQRLAGTKDGARVIHQFVPLDVPRWIGRFLRRWRPDAAALTESELWPNLIEACHRNRIPLALLNARLSDRARAGWGRLPGLAARMLGRFAWIAARSDLDAARFHALGAERIDTPGDLKNAAPPLPADPAALAHVRALLAHRPVWLAAATHEGEEDAIASAARQVRIRHPDLLTIIVPRHPERGPAIAESLDNAPRRAAGQEPGPPDAFWICDTLGELGLFYRAVPIVFIGNSLPGPGRRGGHNPLEPARFGAALATGPLTENFLDAFALLGDAVQIVPDADALAAWVDTMLADPARRAEAGQRAAAATHADSTLPNRLATRLLALTDAR